MHYVKILWNIFPSFRKLIILPIWFQPSLAPVRMCCNLGSLYERTTWSTTGPASTNQSWHGEQLQEVLPSQCKHVHPKKNLKLIHYENIGIADHWQLIHPHPLIKIKQQRSSQHLPNIPAWSQHDPSCPWGWCRWATFRPAKRVGSPRRELKCCFLVAPWWIPPANAQRCKCFTSEIDTTYL